jgi:GT2 family glycosyltransferase
MSSRNPELSVIIVNWNSAGFLDKCLESIYRETREVTFEIIVCDNASFDGCDHMLRDKYPEVGFIQLDENRGFARANNIGAAGATGRLLCFLNPDTELRGNAFGTVRDAMNASGAAGTGAAGCRLLNSDLSLQTSCVMPFPTIANQLFDIEWLKMKTFRWRLWGINALFQKDSRLPVEVEALSGACMFIKPEVFTAVGGFSEEYFMYSEDVDLCRRIQKAGFRVVYCPNAEIVHHGGGSTQGKTPGLFSTVMMREALYRYFTVHRSRAYARLYRCLMFTASILRLAAVVTAAPLFLVSGKGGALVPALKKWWYIAGWATGNRKGIIRGDRGKS